MQQSKITVLGTSAIGVPSFFCGCRACREAAKDPMAARGCCGLAVSCGGDGCGGGSDAAAGGGGAVAGAAPAAAAAPAAGTPAAGTPAAQGSDAAGSAERQDVTLIDTSPDLRHQLVREGVSRVDRVIFTHEHYDHIGGLPQLEFFVRLKLQKPLPVYAGRATILAIEQQFAFMLDTLELHCLEMWDQLEFAGVRYTMLPATHSEGCFGILIESDAKRVAYFPDTAALAPEAAERLEGIDALLLDATFNGANWLPYSHNSIAQAIKTARTIQAKHTFLTHLSMHYDEPITTAELEAGLAAHGGAISAAYDGLKLDL